MSENVFISGNFLLPDDPIHKTSSSWTCHYLPYKNSLSNDGNISIINSSLNSTKSIKHKVESKVVKEVTDKFKRLVSKTDRTDIKANLKILGTYSFDHHHKMKIIIRFDTSKVFSNYL